MALRKTKFVQGEIYHVYNRGVDKRDIFMDEEDRFRFIHDLYEFNDKKPALNLNDHLLRSKNNNLEVGLPDIKREPRELLVEILAFCMMDNHFHLMIRQVADNGVTEFMRKLGTGYTNYFNKKYERNGSLFQGKFKAVHIEEDSHLMYLPIYIHFNPLDFKFPEWRDGKMKNHKKAIEFLDSYKWSSYMDYTGQKNFPSLIKKDFILGRLGNELEMKKEMVNWLKNFNSDLLEEVIIE